MAFARPPGVHVVGRKDASGHPAKPTYKYMESQMCIDLNKNFTRLAFRTPIC